MAKKIIKIGVDFDGVIAYNPVRIARAPIVYLKRDILGIKKLKFFVPKNNWQKFLWMVAFESSIFPAKGTTLLIQMAKQPNVEIHLVTARFNFLQRNLIWWLNRHKMKNTFKTINLNVSDKQPHLFKEEIIQKNKFDFFIEDNWDIVNYLRNRTKTKVLWIYNILDRGTDYQYKFPYLERALQEIQP